MPQDTNGRMARILDMARARANQAYQAIAPENGLTWPAPPKNDTERMRALEREEKLGWKNVEQSQGPEGVAKAQILLGIYRSRKQG